MVCHEGEHHVAHRVLEYGADHFRAEEFVENRDHFLHGKILEAFVFCLEHVHAHGTLDIRRIEVNHVIHALFWNVPKNLFDEIAVRIHNGDSVSLFNVLNSHLGNELRFSRAGFADDVHVPLPIRFLNPHGRFHPTV